MVFPKPKFFALATIATLVATAGCSGHAGNTLPQAPASQSGKLRHTSDTVAGASLFHKNSEKYSDTGSHPVTGRSGSATIQSRALLAKDGTTLVEATTGTLDAQPGAGNIRHVTVTPTLVDGTADETQTYNNLKAGGYWSHTYTGLARNQAVRVDTNITDLDPRTDVVTTNDTVKKRPDLAALKLAGPAKAYPNQQVTFTATVSELNGDVGAHADCVLSADGQQVDQSQGIWVDAAGTVSCAFQTSFATTGSKHMSIAVTNVVPGDWDTSNNTAQTTIEIVDPIVKLQTQAYAYSYNEAQNGTQTYSDPWSNSSTTYSYAWTNAYAYVSAYTSSNQFAFPAAQFAMEINSDGTDVVNHNFASTMASPQGSCQYDFEQGAYANICSGPSWTNVYAQVYGSSATYYSQNVSTDCYYWYGCTTNSWVSNWSESSGNPFTIGHTTVFSVKLADAAGTQFVGATQPAISNVQSWRNPYSYCYGYDWYYGGSWCDNGVDSETQAEVSGFGSGN